MMGSLSKGFRALTDDHDGKVSSSLVDDFMPLHHDISHILRVDTDSRSRERIIPDLADYNR